MNIKLPSLKPLNTKGFGHVELVLAMLVIGGVGFAGARMLTASHAATLPANILWAYSDYQQTAPYTTTGYLKQADTANVISNLVSPSTTAYMDGLSYSPDHQKIAWLQTNGALSAGKVAIYTVATKTITYIAMPNAIIPEPNVGIQVAWFPNGNKLAFTGQGVTSDGTTNNLYTVNSDGSGLTQVPNMASTGKLWSLSVTGNGTYIIGASDSGVYAVKPGSLPITLGKNCSVGVSRPGTNQALAMLCNSYTTTSSTSSIRLQTIGSSAATTLISSTGKSVVGNVSKGFADIAWSPDGTKLGINYSTADYEGQCNTYLTPKVGTLPAAGGSITVLRSGTTSVGNGCRGGRGSKSIAWNQDGSSLGYLWGQSLYKTTVPATGSAKLLSSQAYEVAW